MSVRLPAVTAWASVTCCTSAVGRGGPSQQAQCPVGAAISAFENWFLCSFLTVKAAFLLHYPLLF